MKKNILLFSVIISFMSAYGQTGVLKGRVYNDINNEAIAFANIIIENSQNGATSDENGLYKIENLEPGSYNIICSFLGFKKAIFYEVIISSTKPTNLDIALTEESSQLAQVELKASPFKTSKESPISRQTISANEIYRSPGANRDISKVIQNLPGVATTVAFRNDIIVRGGAPNENSFYLDGIEVPNINHFATQGSSGGPVGMINVNFIRNVDFYAGAFPANRGNAMSSVMEFQQINGNDEKLRGTFMLGSSDVGLTLDGPMGEHSTFMLSARRSYLQYLFQALNLPFLPTYNDFQYKQLIKMGDKNELTLIGLAAIDDFELNKDVNDGLTDKEDIDRNNFILGVLPVNTQWNYAIGANWKHYADHSFQNVVFSRNHLNNSSVKYIDNLETPQNLILDYNSQEIENKLRIENTWQMNGWKWNMGGGYQYITYNNETFQKTEIKGIVETLDFESEINVSKFSLFTQISNSFFKDRLDLSFGLRTDFNNFSKEMSNPVDQLSPRLSASYHLTSKLDLNFNMGRYYQLPAYTVLGYRDNNDVLVNKENKIRYIENNQIVGGLAFKPDNYSKISIESFYKKYDDYPFLLNDSISLANLGGDFGVIGSEPAKSISQGRSYGLEIMLQQKLSASIYGILSYTYVRSEFKDKNGEYVPSSWDNRHILNISAGKRLKNNWEVGMKFRYFGGAPYTPIDQNLSSQKEVWDVTQRGINDWDRLNAERNGGSHGLDIRVDKKWYFSKWALNAYLDVQNVYNSETEVAPYLDVQRDSDGNPLEDPNNPSAYQTNFIDNTTGTVLPSVGIMIEF